MLHQKFHLLLFQSIFCATILMGKLPKMLLLPDKVSNQKAKRSSLWPITLQILFKCCRTCLSFSDSNLEKRYPLFSEFCLLLLTLPSSPIYSSLPFQTFSDSIRHSSLTVSNLFRFIPTDSYIHIQLHIPDLALSYWYFLILISIFLIFGKVLLLPTFTDLFWWKSYKNQAD